MRGTDLTPLATGEGPAALSVAVDRCSAVGAGIPASLRAPRKAAPAPSACASAPGSMALQRLTPDAERDLPWLRRFETIEERCRAFLAVRRPHDERRRSRPR